MTADLSFIGRNIRFLRRSRNWTLDDLSSRIGIHKVALGRIERGINLPSAMVIYQLSTAFNVPVDTLFSPDPIHQAPVATTETTDTCFISLDPEPAPLPGVLMNACREIMAAFHALEDICGVPKHATVPLSIPFDPDYPGMEALAARMRTYLATGDAVVFDYFELFENAGLRVILFPFPRGAAEMASVSFYEPAFHNAFFFLNSRNNPEKQLFALAGELGSILVSNQMRRQKAPLFPPPEDDAGRPINPARAAGRFAATFLMPEPAVRATAGQLGVSRDAWSWDLLLRIKHRFGVSAQTFLYRLHELDLISDPTRDTLDTQIKEFYAANGLIEPDASRRCLTPNGRFFDLLLTAQGLDSAQKEIQEIKAVVKEFKLVKM
ncbi:MAG: XRE family transcriptional regulator [Desulfotignum sp.]|nr:XRE family transcriptional regulator [Desulfotignum sp.]MCF8086792.1 XRE family transcriptional regulator [Desulfotignum sp.]MCF8136742.1 XRE family transcriptional regulator [Desulfotignum sp.]